MKRYQLVAIIIILLAGSYVGNSKAADFTGVSFGGAQYTQTGEQQSTDTGASITASFSF